MTHESLAATRFLECVNDNVNRLGTNGRCVLVVHGLHFFEHATLLSRRDFVDLHAACFERGERLAVKCADRFALDFLTSNRGFAQRRLLVFRECVPHLFAVEHQERGVRVTRDA